MKMRMALLPLHILILSTLPLTMACRYQSGKRTDPAAVRWVHLTGRGMAKVRRKEVSMIRHRWKLELESDGMFTQPPT